MDFQDSFFNRHKIIIIAISIILIIGIIIGLCVIFFRDSDTDVLVATPEPNVTDNVVDVVESGPLPSETPVVSESVVIQEDDEELINFLQVYIKSVKDSAVKVEYEASVILGDTNVETTILADTHTLFYDFNKKALINYSDVSSDSFVTVYALGDYRLGQVTAKLIAIGSNNSYRYAEITSKELVDDYYVWSIVGTSDKIIASKDCPAVNAVNIVTGYSAGYIDSGTAILYQRDSNFESTEIGNIYHCTEVINLGEV